MNDKVCCDNCKYFVEQPKFGYPTKYFCKSPSNTKIEYTWKSIVYTYDLEPSEINKNNNCKWFIEK